MELTDDLKAFFIDTAEKLKGTDRRCYMAQLVKLLGRGGQQRAQDELGWDRKTIRKGLRELDSGQPIEDNFSARGRKPIEYHIPKLLEDIETIVGAQSQTDPTFQTSRLYTRLSAAAVRRALIKQKGYTDQELPSEETIRVKLNSLNYRLRAVQKSRPKKRSLKPMPFSTN